jgi:hypothetical protein
MSADYINTPEEGVGTHRLGEVLDIPSDDRSAEEKAHARFVGEYEHPIDRARNRTFEARTVPTGDMNDELAWVDPDDSLHAEWIQIKLIEYDGGYSGVLSADNKFKLSQQNARVYFLAYDTGEVREAGLQRHIPTKARESNIENIDLRTHFKTSLMTTDDRPTRQFEVDALRPTDAFPGGDGE